MASIDNSLYTISGKVGTIALIAVVLLLLTLVSTFFGCMNELAV